MSTKPSPGIPDSCGTSILAGEESWREGDVEFDLKVEGKRGKYTVELFYRDASEEQPIEAVPLVGGQRSGVPRHKHILHLDGSGTMRRAFTWDSRGTIQEAKQVSIVARSRGAPYSTDIFWIDNTRTGSVAIDGPVSQRSRFAEGEYENVISMPLKFEGGVGAAEPRAMVRLQVLGNDSGNATVVELTPEVSFKLQGSGPQRTLEWFSHLDIPDDHALVRLEIAPWNQVKWGAFVPTECFYVDNRPPRILVVDPQTAASDARFTLRASGQGLCWPGSGPESMTRLSLTRPRSDPAAAAWIEPISSKPPAPTNDLAARARDCRCAENLQADLFGPAILAFSIGPEELRQFDIDGHRGAVTVHLRNPNGRVHELEGSLFLGPSQLSPVGSYYLLEGRPRKVVLGDLAPNLPRPGVGGPGGVPLSSVPGQRHLDAAVIYGDRNVVTILGGDGDGFFPDRWVVPLSSRGARPLAIAPVPSLSGGCDGLLVATEKELELIRCLSGQRGSFSSEVVARELAPEPETRDLALADFDGDGTDDVAVSSRVRSIVQVFHGGRNGDDWVWGADPGFDLEVSLPRSITAANFDADAIGLADLVILGDREGVDTLYFHRNDGLGIRPEPDASLTIPEGAVAVESQADGLFNEGDIFPDVIVVRNVGVGRLLVVKNKDGEQFNLTAFPRPTGTNTDTPTAAALVHLPAGVKREGKPLWDVVSVDAEFFATAYADKDGVQAGEKSTYRLPGPGQDLSAGDVNEDGVDDVAVVTDEPPSFQVFLGRTTCLEDVDCDLTALQVDPFVLPAGRRDGENLAIFPKGEDLKLGVHGGKTFIAVVTRVRDEVFLAWMNADATAVESVGHFGGLGKQLRSLAIGNFNFDEPGDEIAVSSQTEDSIWLLDPGDGSKEELVAHVDLRREYFTHLPPEIPADEEFNSAKMNAAHLNGAGPPEIFLGVFIETTDKPLTHDFVIVIVDPGSPGQEIHFYRTLDDPRHCSAANINGDSAPDLVIACEGADPDAGNSVHILFGDPLRTGGRLFFDEEADPGNRPGWIAPLQLPAFPETEGQVEVVITDSRVVSATVDPSGFTLANFIIASNSPLVIAYRLQRGIPFPDQSCTLPGYPKSHDAGGPPGLLFVDCPEIILEGGGDPEDLALADFFPDRENNLDIVVADEDKSTVELLQFIQFSPGRGTWGPHATLPLGTPYGVAALPRKDGRVSIVVGSRLRREIVFYKPSCLPSGECFYTPAPSQPLFEAPLAGSVTSFTAVCAGDLGVLTASLVEDRDVVTRMPGVDMTLFPHGMDRKALAFLGNPDGTTRSVRLHLAEEMAPDAVLLTDLASPQDGSLDDFPDLLLHEPLTGSISVLPLTPPSDTEPIQATGEPVPIEDLALPGALIDWELLVADGRTILLAASAAGVRAVDLLPTRAAQRVDVALPASPTLRQLAHGWQGEARDDVARAFLILLVDRDVLVARLDATDPPRSLLADTPGAQAQNVLLRAGGAGDLNGDHVDDIVVVDAPNSSLLVLLGVESTSLDFEPARTFPYPGQLEPVQLTFLDSNGDTVRDVAFGALDGTVLLFSGTGDGTFGGAEQLFAGPELENLSAFDLDGDGTDEILAAVGVPGLVVLSTRVAVSQEGGGQ